VNAKPVWAMALSFACQRKSCVSHSVISVTPQKGIAFYLAVAHKGVVR